jgi:hypothetical protein
MESDTATASKKRVGVGSVVNGQEHLHGPVGVDCHNIVWIVAVDVASIDLYKVARSNLDPWLPREVVEATLSAVGTRWVAKKESVAHDDVRVLVIVKVADR